MVGLEVVGVRSFPAGLLRSKRVSCHLPEFLVFFPGRKTLLPPVGVVVRSATSLVDILWLWPRSARASADVAGLRAMPAGPGVPVELVLRVPSTFGFAVRDDLAFVFSPICCLCFRLALRVWSRGCHLCVGPRGRDSSAVQRFCSVSALFGVALEGRLGCQTRQ